MIIISLLKPFRWVHANDYYFIEIIIWNHIIIWNPIIIWNYIIIWKPIIIRNHIIISIR